jgi:hypothetical protein
MFIVSLRYGRLFVIWNPPLKQGIKPEAGFIKAAGGRKFTSDADEDTVVMDTEDMLGGDLDETLPVTSTDHAAIEGVADSAYCYDSPPHTLHDDWDDYAVVKQASLPVGGFLTEDEQRETIESGSTEVTLSPPVPLEPSPAATVTTPLTAKVSASGEEWKFTPKKVRFLMGCSDARPQTIGQARSLVVHDPLLGQQPAVVSSGAVSVAVSNVPSSGAATAAEGAVSAGKRKHGLTPAFPSNPAYDVKYVGGWKRGRHQTRGRAVGQSSGADTAEGTASVDGNRVVGSEPGSEIAVAQEPIDDRRTSTIWETSCLFSALVRQRLKTIAFCRTRKLVELVLGYTLRDLDVHNAAHMRDSVVSYRGGYTKEERRGIETDLFSGRVLGVTATCALELGIDVGSLDATLHMGFPGTYASLWQQAGRAGRSGRPSLSVVVCFDGPIDQYFARNPSVLFHTPVEPAVLDVGNVHILYSHLRCAAEEIPLNYSFVGSRIAASGTDASVQSSAVRDSDIWGDRYVELLQYLVESRKISPLVVDGSSRGNRLAANSVHKSSSGEVLCGTQFKVAAGTMQRAAEVNLRQIDPVTVRVLDSSRGGIEIDSLGYSRAFFELFEGAIYLHRAVQYRVTHLDLVRACAHCRPVRVKYYTSANNGTTITVTKIMEHDGVCSCGTVQVVNVVFGYMKRWLGSGEVFERVRLLYVFALYYFGRTRLCVGHFL